MSSWPYLIAPARSAWPGRGRVTGAPMRAGRVRCRRLADGHRPLPVHPVLVPDQQRDRRPQREPAADTGQHLHRDPTRWPCAGRGRSRPAAGAAAGRSASARAAGRQASLEDGDERFAVGLAGSQKSQHLGIILAEVLARFRAESRAARLAPAQECAGFCVNSRRRRRSCTRDTVMPPVSSPTGSSSRPRARPSTWRRARRSGCGACRPRAASKPTPGSIAAPHCRPSGIRTSFRSSIMARSGATASSRRGPARAPPNAGGRATKPPRASLPPPWSSSRPAHFRPGVWPGTPSSIWTVALRSFPARRLGLPIEPVQGGAPRRPGHRLSSTRWRTAHWPRSRTA